MPLPPVSVSLPTSQGAVTLTTQTPQQQAVNAAGGNPAAALLPTQSTISALAQADPKYVCVCSVSHLNSSSQILWWVMYCSNPATAVPVIANVASQFAGVLAAQQAQQQQQQQPQQQPQQPTTNGISATGDRIIASGIDPFSGNRVTVGLPVGTGTNNPLNSGQNHSCFFLAF